ncbi:MAG: hypothetical protein LBB36_00290, partial [Fibromonadaceae bacterium]|nr:hypothetical protein [Fibromonadaceae bacterium]
MKDMPASLQTMEEARDNVPEKQKEWLSGVWKTIAKGKKVNPKYQQSLGKVSEKTKEAVKKFYGKNVSKQVITPGDLLHIYERHGKYPKAEIKNNQIPVTVEIAVLILDVLANPDDVIKGDPTKKMGYEKQVFPKRG